MAIIVLKIVIGLRLQKILINQRLNVGGDSMNQIEITTEQTDYFIKLEKDLKITLSPGQRRWYCMQQSILGDKIQQEFPSTIEESFLSSSDAYYYAEYIAKAYKEGRILNTSPYD